MHQRNARRTEAFTPQENEAVKVHPRTNRPSVSIFESSSAFSFAMIGVVLLLVLIGGVIMLSDSSSSRAPIDERIPVVSGRNAKKLSEELSKKKVIDETAEEYAQRVRERYLSRIAKLREQEMKRLAEEAVARGDNQQETEPQDENPSAVIRSPTPEPNEQINQARPPQAEVQSPQAEVQPPAVDLQPQAANANLEESLKLIHEQLARLQAGIQQKEVEKNTPAPSYPLKKHNVRQKSKNSSIRWLSCEHRALHLRP